jgi:hypothetical protein
MPRGCRQGKSQTTANAKASKPSYRGKNHFWFPSLGINQSVYSFPCSRSKAPGNVVYRWGCAGSNNVYLMAHDFGKFYPLYKAYKNGRLRKGMLAVYAGPNGRTHFYRLSFYKVVAPDGDVGWARLDLRSALTLGRASAARCASSCASTRSPSPRTWRSRHDS